MEHRPAESGAVAAVETVGIYGAGAVAAAFVSRLARAGVAVRIAARRREQALRLAAQCGPGGPGGPGAPGGPGSVAAVGGLADLEGVALAVLAVADGALAEVAAQAAAAWVAPRVVLHTSGALGPEVLAGLADRGHAVGGLHPLAALPPGGDGAPLVEAWYALSGAERAVAAGRRLIAALRGREAPRDAAGRELVLAADGAARLLYHAGAALVSGGVAAALAHAERALVAAGAEPSAARAALCALAATAVENVAARGAAAAVTGPATRGDAALVAAHLAALRGHDGGTAALYRALLPTLAELGRARGTVDAAAAAQLAALGRDTQRP